MLDGIRIGSVSGIPVKAHWSVAVVGWLLSWSLATAILPQSVAGAPPAAYWAAGLLAALALFASLLAHEAGHALVARRAGLRVEAITLWLFGGMAHLHDDAPDPGVEARVAGVGPAVSLTLGALFGGMALGLTATGAPELLVSVVTWLAAINAGLAVFNLLPGAPLDGGRLLRAWLWRRSGDRYRATLGAGRAGRVLGLGLVVLGLAEIAFRADLSGLWTLLLGWFLLSAAQAEIAEARASRALAGLRVGDVMTPDPVTVPNWLSVTAFLREYAQRHRHTTFPLLAFDGSADGLLAVTDTLRVPAELRDRTQVRDLAAGSDRALTAAPDEVLVDVLRRLGGRPGGRVLVVEDGRLVGLVTSSDVTRAVLLGEAGGDLGSPSPTPVAAAR